MKKIVIVLPAFHEEKMIAKVIKSIRTEGFDNIIVVDDGSLDNTYQVAKKSGVTVLKHLINRGKGATTQTGLDAAKILGADITVTLDSDGQHKPTDIKNIIKPLLNNECDFVLGSRFKKKNSQIPISKVFMNKIGNIVTFLFYGIFVSDSQSGFRAYSKKANNLIQTSMDRYEFESEILNQIKRYNLKFQEVPIDVIYSKHSKTKYNSLVDFPKQDLFNGFRMLYRMIIKSIFT